MTFPSRVPTTAQLRAHEAEWIENCNANWGAVLMEQAGRATAEVAMSYWRANNGLVVILCGSGNNGGDGLVIARYLSMSGVPVSVYLVPSSGQKATRTEFGVNREIYEKLGFQINIIDQAMLTRINEDLSRSTLIIDALLGTGLDRSLEGIYRSLVESVNLSGKTVVSVDIPSGIHSDSGQIMGSAVKATATVTFGFLKAGLLCHPGASLCGKLSLVDIGLPALDYKGTDPMPQWFLSTSTKVAAMLPVRPTDSNKGDFGK